MEKYYSQHGEDFLLDKIFQGKKDGFFVEIGCLDGIEFSNSYFFEKKGWRGICVEAHNDFAAELKKNRPRSLVVHCAVGETDKEQVTFYANKLGSLSTLDRNEEERWKANYGQYFHGFEEQSVPMRTLTTIFDEARVQQIDFLSLDIEGYEIKALEGLDFSKYKPAVFVIEYKDDTHKHALEKILFPQGYHFIRQIGCNLIYTLNIAHASAINEKYGPINLVVFENGVEKRRTFYFDTPLHVKVKNSLRNSIVGKIWASYKVIRNRIRERLVVPSYAKKRKIIDGYRVNYKLNVFVETGTFLGDTVDFFSKRFSKIYSIELSDELYKDAVKRFETSQHVAILQGDSGNMLKDLVATIDAPTLFWLDGHYSSEFFFKGRYIKTARGKTVTPILAELDAIFSDEKHQHVILIDDARLFNGQWDYPTIDQLVTVVNKQRGRYALSLSNDIIRIVPANAI